MLLYFVLVIWVGQKVIWDVQENNSATQKRGLIYNLRKVDKDVNYKTQEGPKQPT
jgi:hypothetical protein